MDFLPRRGKLGKCRTWLGRETTEPFSGKPPPEGGCPCPSLLGSLLWPFRLLFLLWFDHFPGSNRGKRGRSSNLGPKHGMLQSSQKVASNSAWQNSSRGKKKSPLELGVGKLSHGNSGESADRGTGIPIQLPSSLGRGSTSVLDTNPISDPGCDGGGGRGQTTAPQGDVRILLSRPQTPHPTSVSHKLESQRKRVIYFIQRPPG